LNITLNEIAIKNYLKTIEKAYPDLLENHAFISWMSNDLLWTERLRPRSKMAPLSGYPLLDRRLKAIDKSFLDSTYTSLYTLTEYDKSLNISKTTTNKIDINKMLYDNPNTPKVLKEKNDSFIYPQNDNRRIQKINPSAPHRRVQNQSDAELMGFYQAY
jgi:hypothetical protein